MLEFLEHLKKWAEQDQGVMSARDLADALIRICDDGIRDLRAAELLRAADTSKQPCPNCNGVGYVKVDLTDWQCAVCHGSGQV